MSGCQEDLVSLLSISQSKYFFVQAFGFHTSAPAISLALQQDLMPWMFGQQA